MGFVDVESEMDVVAVDVVIEEVVPERRRVLRLGG